MQLEALRPHPIQQVQRVDGRLATSSANPSQFLACLDVFYPILYQRRPEEIVPESRCSRKRHKAFRNDGGGPSSNVAGPGCFRVFGAEHTRSAALENEM